MATSTIPRKRRFLKPRKTRRPIIDGNIQCSKCKNWKPANSDYFGASNHTQSGLQSWCKSCKKNAPRKPYISTPERRAKIREYSKLPKVKEKARNYRLTHHVGNEEHNAKIRARNATPEAKAKRQEYNQRPEVKERNRIRQREYLKDYRKTPKYKETRKRINQQRKNNPKHKALLKVSYQKRQARKRDLPNTLTTEQWQFAVEYFNGCCAVCGRPLKDLFSTHTTSMDHWIPLSSPDCPGTTANNCIPLCHGEGGCNGSKNNRPPMEWLVKKYGKRKARMIMKRIQEYFDALPVVVMQQEVKAA